MGIAGLILLPHLSKFGKSFLFYSCTSDVIVISRNSQWVKSCKISLSLPVQVFRGSCSVIGSLITTYLHEKIQSQYHATGNSRIAKEDFLHGRQQGSYKCGCSGCSCAHIFFRKDVLYQ